MVGFVEQRLAILNTRFTLDVRGVKAREGVWEVVAVYGTEKEDYVAWSIQIGKILKGAEE